MAQYYTKINTLYKREPTVLENGEKNPRKNLIMPGQYSNAETEILKDLLWECTEKIDGTNISLHIFPLDPYGNEVRTNPDGSYTEYKLFGFYDTEIHGKTPASVIPSKLLKNLMDICNTRDFKDVFTVNGIPPQEKIEIFGEGYGTGIQKGGGYCKDDQKFIVFDIKIGDHYVRREIVEDVCKKLNLDIVPLIGYMTIAEAEEMVKKGFTSRISENPNLMAEGLVCKAPLGMLDARGNRIITKIKSVDYNQLKKFEENVK